MIILTAFITGLLCYLFGPSNGYKDAHLTIALEIKRLGGFYVNDKTYKCTEVVDTIPSPQQE